MKKTRLIPILLAAVVAVTSPCMNAAASEGGYYSDDEYHADVDFADMDFEWVDEEAVMAELDEYEKTIKTGTDEEVIAGYDRILEITDDIETRASLNDIRYNSDIFNNEYKNMNLKISEFYDESFDRALGLMRDALKSSHGDALKKHIDNDEWVEGLLDYEDMTDEEKQLDKEYEELKQEYDRLIVGDVHVKVDGEDWSFARFQEESYDLGYEEYYKVVGALSKAYNDMTAPIYISIVEKLNREAELYGYDNYADYAYENIYARDYTTEEIHAVYDGVRDYIVPLKEELDADYPYNLRLEVLAPDAEDRINRVAPVISRIHPDLQQAWDYMIEHHLYDIEASDSKMDTGYTTTLDKYGSAFIFDKPYGNWNDIQTVIHEFGHYNEAFHGTMHSLQAVHNVDVAEIHSQGLELLCLEYADDVYGKGCKKAVVNRLLSKMMGSVIEGCIYDEFQYEAYTYEGELTVDKLNEIYCDVINRYGKDCKPDDYEVMTWVQIPHTFESPMYYIGYATSALAALDILAMSVEDRDAAIDCYMHLTTYHGELGFRETIDDVGLPDIFEDGVIEDISIAVRDYIRHGSGKNGKSGKNEQDGSNGGAGSSGISSGNDHGVWELTPEETVDDTVRLFEDPVIDISAAIVAVTVIGAVIARISGRKIRKYNRQQARMY